METLDDVIQWFNQVPFVINPLITIILKGGAYNAPRILAILIDNDKNEPKRGYQSANHFIQYLRS
jgi:hypothetical protein